MQREIKFRSWDRLRKEMVYFDDLYWFEENFVSHLPDFRHIVQQYTGLVDKNEIPIYEGDIIQYRDGSHQAPFYDKVIVEWKSENDGYDYNGWKLTDVFLQGGEREVVGNIFQNPELLKL